MSTPLRLTDPNTISGLLQDAMDLRSKFVIALTREQGSRFDVTGLLREIGDNTLAIEISGLSANPRSWVGQMVQCYFKVRERSKKSDIFYNFPSPVLETAASRSDYLLSLKRPTTLEIGQRRSSLRVDPASGDILNFSLWEEGRMVAKNPETGQIKLRPPLIGGEHFEEGMVSVQDVSAGGIRLRLVAQLLTILSLETCQEKEPLAAKGTLVAPAAWTKGTKVVIWLVLNERAKNSHQVFWLKGRISYKREDYQSKDMEFGVEFTQHGKNDPSGKIVWNPVLENDIQELGAQVYQWYLERFRKGIA